MNKGKYCMTIYHFTHHGELICHESFDIRFRPFKILKRHPPHTYADTGMRVRQVQDSEIREVILEALKPIVADLDLDLPKLSWQKKVKAQLDAVRMEWRYGGKQKVFVYWSLEPHIDSEDAWYLAQQYFMEAL